MSLASLGTRLVRHLPPERAHTATIRALKTGLGTPLTPPSSEGLAVTLPRSGLKLANPIGLAAGFDKNAEVFKPMLRFGFGFVECGTVTPRPQAGNPKPRLFRLTEDQAVINRMGFNNDGLGPYVERLKRGGANRLPVGANVGANKDSEDRIADYETGLRAVWPHCAYVTINISSPNTPGLRGLQNKGELEDLLTRCGAVAGELAEGAVRPVFLKVAPDLDSDAISEIATSVRGPGAWLAGLIISNTTLARPASLRSAHASETGGLSGAPLMEPSTEVLRQFAEILDGEFDLIGAGGIASGADAYAKLKAGAHAVQLYSALVYHGPELVGWILSELRACLERGG